VNGCGIVRLGAHQFQSAQIHYGWFTGVKNTSQFVVAGAGTFATNDMGIYCGSAGAASASFATPQLFTAKTFITSPSAVGAFKSILGKY